MQLFRIIGIVIMLSIAFSVSAQPQSDLTTGNIQIVNSVGDFGQPMVEAVGQLTNNSDSAYTAINLDAKAYDGQDQLVGEGLGVLVNACGVGLAPDFSLQPGAAQRFTAPLELTDSNVSIARIEVSATAQPADPAPHAPLPDGMVQLTDAETVNVIWLDDHSFQYSTGCESDLFTNWTWYSYDTATQATSQIAAPHAEDVTDEMRARLELDDDAVFAHSMMRYAPDGERLVYQNERNDFLTAYLNGTFRRGLYNDLNNRSLQGIYWQPQEKYLAYYYGAYGDPVYYFAADAEARVISPPLEKNPPSVIVPGFSRDGRRIVLAGTFDDGTGYYLYVATNGFFELQFKADPPGNNYPAPIPLAHPTDSDTIDQIYVALPVDGAAELECYNRGEGTLHALASLPISHLADDEHAWWWIAPDDSKIALAATGVNGGLWLIDLTALPDCGAEATATPAP
ncbi:MAG: hypothetical protein GC204_13240 [Chloroflexi bacterium]|nr:hypothetical protein [Chloroflexota bacterium]